jgi:hypothetical protein
MHIHREENARKHPRYTQKANKKKRQKAKE